MTAPATKTQLTSDFAGAVDTEIVMEDAGDLGL